MKRSILYANKSKYLKKWHKLSEIYQKISAEVESQCLQPELTYSRFQVLKYLYFHSPKQQVEISNELNVSRASISSFIKRLLKDELVKIENVSNSNRINYSLTKGGKQIFEKKYSCYSSFISDTLKKIEDI